MPSMTPSLTDLLGAPSVVEQALQAAYQAEFDDNDGALPTSYPVMTGVDPHLFGLTVVDGAGQHWSRGDVEVGFGLMSTAKPFTFALVCAAIGVDRVGAEIGLNATGGAYNDPTPVRTGPDGRTNPMVNAGAIATCTRLPGDDREAQWTQLLAGLSAFAGRPLELDQALYENVSATNVRNRELANALADRGLLVGGPDDALELYTRQSCVSTTASDLAVMGATLANGGRNPVTGVQVVPAEVCAPVLAVMITSGLYDTSGEWLYQVRLPAKTGLGGGIVTVIPGRGAIGGFSPLLDAAANTVRGARATMMLVERLGLSLF
ncbi:MAG TPA: glutaminase [Propionibacteriaceae bacterium]|nr:glutaminase [Propionibacteriaceae bacterium]